MKKLLAVMVLGFGLLSAQTITPIADIQFVASSATSDSSLLNGTTVTVSGVITSEFWGSYKNRYFFVQDADTAWSGIEVFEYGGWDSFAFEDDAGAALKSMAEGDSVTITGTVDEYYNLTEIVDITKIVVHGPATNPPAPIVVTPGQIKTGGTDAEKYEGVLIRVEDVTVSNANEGNGEWSITDGTDTVRVDDTWEYYYFPDSGQVLGAVIGTLDYTYGNHKIQPRLARDVKEAGGNARIQRVQQVLYSDLLKAPDDGVSDMSYMCRDYDCLDESEWPAGTVVDTITMEGIVTMPTGLSYAGAGVKFLFADINGGPWSGIMSYDPDSSAFPVLREGYIVKVTGYVAEYTTTQSNMTEFFVTDVIDLVSTTGVLSDTTVITTGDFMHPTTIEQWGTVIVRVESAVVTSNAEQFQEWIVDDGTGEAWIDDDSDSLSNFVRPPVGTNIKRASGWVYHHYGSYALSNTYKLEPLYVTDIEIGGGPPSVANYSADFTASGPADAVPVSVEATDATVVASMEIMYRINGGATWTSITMTAGTGDAWNGTISGVATEGDSIEFFFLATDDGLEIGQDAPLSTVYPDTSNKMFGYVCRAAGPSISDVQGTSFAKGDSYYDSGKAILSGTVTGLTDPTAVYPDGEDELGFSMQDAPGAWNGIVGHVVPNSSYTPTVGDSITVIGIVDDSWSIYGFRFDNSTIFHSIDSVVVHATGKSTTAATATTAQVAADPEAYEGVQLNIGQVKVTAINPYDWSVAAGTDTILIDDDWLGAANAAADSLDSLKVDDILMDLSGVFHYSFGTFKLEIRDVTDLGHILRIDDGQTLPAVYSLSQNYPNPFNPVTRLAYTLPEGTQHTLKVYNLRGALVETLVTGYKSAGAYEVTWNARRYASGIYFMRLEAGDFRQTRKLILLK